MDCWYENCEICDQLVEVNLWSRDRDRAVCHACQREFDEQLVGSLDGEDATVADWQELEWLIFEESDWTIESERAVAEGG